MFYKKQSKDSLNRYVSLLTKLGSLSRLFSTNDVPYLPYRAVENVFCKVFDAKNHSRSDTSADASKNNVGIGIKTFIQRTKRSFQKIAEFNKNRNDYSKFLKEPKKLVEVVSELRNERIEFAKSLHNVDELIYHCVARQREAFVLFEEPMDLISINKIKIEKQFKNTIHYSDGLNLYNFNVSKSTLLKQFQTTDPFKFEVNIFDDPYSLIEEISGIVKPLEVQGIVYLPLYSGSIDEKYVPEKSGLNQWNAGGRPRANKEVYIRIPAWIHREFRGFFPKRSTSFNLKLPNGKVLSAGIFQDGGKALMSNPNTALGDWLIDEVLKLKPGRLVTYDLLKEVGIDTLEVRKIDSNNYEIDFKKLGRFENFENIYKLKD